jgi:predicted Fe-Mo cluster-binding NifX family protein
MSTSKEHKIAIATRNGTKVAEHFGAAPIFVVLTIKRGKVTAREIRANTMICSHEDWQVGSCWDLMETLLPDVRVVISTGMGENAYVGLLRRDVLPLVTTETDLERAVREYLAGRLQEDPGLVHKPIHDIFTAQEETILGKRLGERKVGDRDYPS